MFGLGTNEERQSSTADHNTRYPHATTGTHP